MQRREDLKNEKRRQEEEAAKAKERRRERRMCLKEQKRIQELVEVLIISVVPQSEQKEYTPAMPVYDIRDYKEERPAGIYTFGGFIGELIISLAAMQEHLIMKADGSFEIKYDTVMKFLEELLLDGYPQGVCFINLTQDLLSDVEKNEEPVEKQAMIAAKKLSEGVNIDGYGIKFMLDICSKIGIAENVLIAVLEAICAIHYHQPKDLIEMPAEEENEQNDEHREKLAEQNDEIEKSNELFSKLKQFVKLVVP